MRKLVAGSRGSDLALTQTKWVVAQLQAAAPGLEVELEIIKTKGDIIRDVPLAKIGGKGLFTKELEVALLEKRIDFAVHSLKDLPTELPAGLAIGAIPPRECPQDALLTRDGKGLEELPQGARVGTSSMRRHLQLQLFRPGLTIVDLRGNVPTRIEKLDRGHYDAIVLAAAGLIRLGLAHRITQLLAPGVMLSAVGQGALAIEIRDEDDEMRTLLRAIHHEDTAVAVAAERALLQGLGGGCQVPVGALATVKDQLIVLNACVCSPDGAQIMRTELTGHRSDAKALGQLGAEALAREGAVAAIAQATAHAAGKAQPLTGKKIVVTRSRTQASELVRQLASEGAAIVELPLIAFQPRLLQEPLDAASAYDWLIFTSSNGVHMFAHALEKTGRSIAEFNACSICAVGPATASAVAKLGLPAALTPPQYLAESILEFLLAAEDNLEGKRFLLPRGNLSRPELPERLRAAGAEVIQPVVYETSAPQIAEAEAEEIVNSGADLVTFTSSSTVRNFHECLTPEQRARVKKKMIFASIGPVTSATCRELDFPVAIEAAEHDVPGLVRAIVAHVTRA
ncbi:MAG: hydroxymethylbilane synthase [Candidatus Hydrogenedentes bacterium]|nr:hydroxymethylbilane synthase [Candidatus Hydrogenedentota bacterium]